MTKRKIIPIESYKRFYGGWSKDLILGLSTRNGEIKDLRMGDLYEDGTFYDSDGSRFRATHVLTLRPKDTYISQDCIVMKKPFVPTKAQIDALERMTKKLPWEKELKELLKGIKTL